MKERGDNMRILVISDSHGQLGNLNEILLPYSIGFVVSMIVTFFTIRWFANVVKNGNFKWFSIYCLLMGLFVLIFL